MRTNNRTIDDLIELAQEDNLLPEFFKILRNTPRYQSGKIVQISDYKAYITTLQDKYERIKYLEGVFFLKKRPLGEMYD